jgi:RNA-directed DNA polymerase
LSKEDGIAFDQNETCLGEPKEDTPVKSHLLLERILARDNMITALRQVKGNKGAAGVDGMTVDELVPYLKPSWPGIREALLSGTYKPKPVKRISIPKPGGGERHLGIPTVLDRLIQQAVLQVLQEEWDPSFSEYSYGFRPGRSAHQAIENAQTILQQGRRWVVDMDLAKFFDRVNHDKLMVRVKQRVPDSRVMRLINAFLKSGVEIGGRYEQTVEGTPQGGPLSPLLANLLLDDLDKELERRGHRFSRYADDCNIYVRSKRAGERVLKSLKRFLGKLKLEVNEKKSAVDRPWKRVFLGFTFTHKPPFRIKVSDKALNTLKDKVRNLTRRTRGHSFPVIVSELTVYLRGWKGYFGLSQVTRNLKDTDKWIRRKLRCYLWKQWSRRGYRELRRHGVSTTMAWNTAKSAHGPWRLSKSPALSIALPKDFFASIGLPSLVDEN